MIKMTEEQENAISELHASLKRLSDCVGGSPATVCSPTLRLDISHDAPISPDVGLVEIEGLCNRYLERAKFSHEACRKMTFEEGLSVGRQEAYGIVLKGIEAEKAKPAVANGAITWEVPIPLWVFKLLKRLTHQKDE